MKKKEKFSSLGICYQGLAVVSAIIQQKLGMSQQNQVQTLESKILINQKPNSLESPNEGKLTCNSLLIPQNPEYQDEYSEYNGLKFQQRQLFPYPRVLPMAEGNMKCQDWTTQEEDLLIQLHNKKGNKWVQIARQLKRNDNSVKNHYHSKLRKTLRKLNKCIQDHLHGQFRLLKNNIISKIVQTAQELYQSKGGQQKQNALKAYALKNKVLSYAYINQQQIAIQQLVQIKKLVSQISEFDNSLKSSQKLTSKSKSGSNKYKGKEIIGLLNENTKIETFNPNSRKSTKANSDPIVSFQTKPQHTFRVPVQQQKKNTALQNSQLQKQMIDGMGVYGNCPTILFFNEGVFPYQSIFYPIYQQPSTDIFSGRNSSFTSYNPQRQSTTENLNLVQWASSNRLQETQFNNVSELNRSTSFEDNNSLY